jgi:hypothetical protein
MVRSIEALRQTLLDARTLLGWLLAQDDRPVGVAGLSLGGTLTLTLACLEERLSFAVPLIAHMDLAALISDAPVLTKMRHDLKSFGWRKKQFDDFIRGVGWYELRPKRGPCAHDRRLKIASSIQCSEPVLISRVIDVVARGARRASGTRKSSPSAFLEVLAIVVDRPVGESRLGSRASRT